MDTKAHKTTDLVYELSTKNDYLDHILAFLTQLCQIEQSGPHTLRAYCLDLEQAFQIPLRNYDFFSLPLPGTPPPCPNADFWLGNARLAQSGWGNLSAASRNRKTATLKSLFGWLHRTGRIDRDIATLLASPRVPRRLPRFLSADEAIALITAQRALAVDDNGRVSFALVALLYGAGLRVSEACTLRCDAIDYKKRALRILGKGGKERVATAPRLVFDAIRAVGSVGTYVFGNKPIPSRRAYELVRRAGAHAGLAQSLNPHALRHSFATHLLQSGAGLRTLQELLGHSSLAATERYLHLGFDELARALERCHPLGETAMRRLASADGSSNLQKDVDAE